MSSALRNYTVTRYRLKKPCGGNSNRMVKATYKGRRLVSLARSSEPRSCSPFRFVTASQDRGACRGDDRDTVESSLAI